MLQELGIVLGKGKKAATLFETLIPDFWSIKYKNPSEYVRYCWNLYENNPTKNKDLNGKFFEYVLTTLCIRENLIPLYLNAKVAFVPNVLFDLMLYSAECGPICLSLKTSLRERYKQADLESIALKYVHRKSLCYLITLDQKEAKNIKNKIKTGDVIGLNDVVICFESEFDALILNLKKFELSTPPTVEVITSNQIVTDEKIKIFKVIK